MVIDRIQHVNDQEIQATTPYNNKSIDRSRYPWSKKYYLLGR